MLFGLEFLFYLFFAFLQSLYSHTCPKSPRSLLSTLAPTALDASSKYFLSCSQPTNSLPSSLAVI
nr:hypothetical protein [uncultured Campylobacter sp.]